jgi:recombination protein RecR
MSLKIDKLDNLVESLMNLPSVGKKSALRFAYHMLLSDNFSAMKLSHAIEEALKSIKKCSICYGLSEDEICQICSDPLRDSSTLCIVENPKDIFTLEESNIYEGKYFILATLEQDNIQKLKDRVIHTNIKEIIFALTPSLANDSIILFIEDQLKEFNISFTKIAQGVPTGVTLENVDMLSLSKALNDRVKI